MKTKITQADIDQSKTRRMFDVSPRVRRATLFSPHDILELRLQNGLTQPEMASKLNISRRTYQQWENGLVLPKNVNLRRLLDMKDQTTYLSLPSSVEIEQTRKAYGMDLQTFANHYKVVIATASRWESGKSTPAPSILRQIAEDYANAKELNLITA